LKAPQKSEIANYMLSLTHDLKSKWTTAIFVGRFLTYQASLKYNPWDSGHTPFEVIRKELLKSMNLWNDPLLLPCLVLKDHLAKTRRFCDGSLIRQVMLIEDQFGTNWAGRSDTVWSNSDRTNNAYRLLQERFNKGAPVEKSRVLNLTVAINSFTTKVMFTKASPTWNLKASKFLLGLQREILRHSEELHPRNNLSELLEYNIPIAISLENHVEGLKKRLELLFSVVSD
jgi:hypothetical protein